MDVKLKWEDKETGVKRVSLPFQTVEKLTQKRILKQRRLDKWTEGIEWPDNYPKDWRNRLIWGDNKFIMSSLLRQGFGGEIDLIYIDPPFATGADFSMPIEVGDIEATKEPSVIEEIAYRDTWGKGLSSYLQMMYDRLVLMRELLSDKGAIYVHLDWRVGHYIKILLDEIFGRENFKNHIVWKRHPMVSGVSSGMEQYSKKIDHILFYSKSENHDFNLPYQEVTDENILNKKFDQIEDETGRRFETQPLILKGDEPSKLEFPSREMELPSGRRFAWNQETLDKKLDENPNIIYWTKHGNPRYKKYKEDYEGEPCSDLWDDIYAISSTSSESFDFPTQKPEKLLNRIITASSNEGSIVADFFCGAGTTGVVAEKLGRRWIMSDLSKFAINTSRKRLLNIHVYSKEYDKPCRPFEIQNLGSYQKHKFIENDHPPVEEYRNFILDLYEAETIEGYNFIHGRRGRNFVHIAGVDSVVTANEVEDSVKECVNNLGGNTLDILGWDFELGLDKTVSEIEDMYGIEINLKQIPREATELKEVSDPEEIKFFDLNYAEIEHYTDGKEVKVELKDFVLANPGYIDEDIREDVNDPIDWIDYWAVDFNYQEDVFHNMWQSFRTPNDRELSTTALHTYEELGVKKIFVKIIDIFGNDTSNVFEVEV